MEKIINNLNNRIMRQKQRTSTYIKEQHNTNCKQFFGAIRNCTFTMNTDIEDEEEYKLHRHYIAVLIQANRYRRDNHVPSIYGMPDPSELGKAIDYAIEKLKEL